MTEAQPTAKPSRGKYIAAGIVVALIGAMMIVWLSGLASSGALNKIGKTGVVHLLTPAGSDYFSVQADAHYYNQFSLPATAIDVKVTGQFIASGGSGNDIIVMIMSDTDYMNWLNGHAYSTYYNSGKVTAGNIDMSLPSGKSYYLVFDNSFSTISNKNVDADIELHYFY